ncbi:MAG: terpene cyclase/mutase family protein [Clostridia bacterium]|nr:terpene cyclase/mutase family protein [Clostridia bacterium]
MSMNDTAMDIVNWLETAVDNTNWGYLIRERYSLTNMAWISRYRTDCTTESAYAFLKAWKHTGDKKYLTLARNLFNGICNLQHEDGSFPYHTGSSIAYTNDNSEVAIFLLRMAEVDSENASAYREKALDITDWLVSIQKEDGSWQRSTATLESTACFTAHAISAISMAYKFTNNREAYKTAVENGLAYISTKIRNDGMVTLMGGNEAQRPPSSDQSICVRSIAHAELYIDDLSNRATWIAKRKILTAWLEQCITEEGAVKNGLGTGANGADTVNVTDYVYTLPFAAEAFYYSSLVDGDIDLLKTAMKIVRFAQGNIYYSSIDNANGVLRGAFNITNRNWDTSDAVLDSGEQGGGNMIYTGWTNAPMAAHFFCFSGAVDKGVTLSIKTDVKAERFIPDDNGLMRICVDGKTVKFPLARYTDVSASAVKLFANGEKQAFAHLS